MKVWADGCTKSSWKGSTLRLSLRSKRTLLHTERSGELRKPSINQLSLTWSPTVSFSSWDSGLLPLNSRWLKAFKACLGRFDRSGAKDAAHIRDDSTNADLCDPAVTVCAMFHFCRLVKALVFDARGVILCNHLASVFFLVMCLFLDVFGSSS